MPSADTFDALLKPYVRRLNLASWMDATVPALLILLGIAATALILAKAFFPVYGNLLAWLFLACPLALVYGCIAVLKGRGFYSPHDAAEILDRALRDDGSVTAFFEKPSLNPFAGWYDLLAAGAKTDFPRLAPGYYAGRLLPALAYVLVALAIPRAPLAENAQARDLLTAMTEPLVQQVEKFGDILPEKEKEQLLAALEDLAQSPEGISAESWEAVEALSQRVSDITGQSADALSGLNEALENALDTAQKAGETSPQALDAAMKELAQAAHTPGCKLPKGLRERLRRMGNKSQGASPADMQKLREQLKGLKKDLKDLARDLDIKDSSRMRQATGTCQIKKPGPGQGGIDRGPGDAPMVFGERKPVPGAQYKKDRLENPILAPSELANMGLVPVAPEPDPGKFSPGVLRAFKERTGPEVSQTRITPVQKDVVARYFGK